MTQATRLFSENMTQPTRDLFRFTLLIHRSARRKDADWMIPIPKYGNVSVRGECVS